MPDVKTIVCLANSRKLSGRCVAGKVLEKGKIGPWLRPVSNRVNEEVSEDERQYSDGSDPQILDIIDIPVLEPRPKSFQTENYLIDPDFYWERKGRASWKEVEKWTDSPKALWLNTDSTYAGLNDRVSVKEAACLTNSLYLLQLDDVKLHVFAPGAAFGNPKRRVQARFEYRGVSYWLRVTDPTYERTYLKKADGAYNLGQCLVAVSLGEPFDGHCYKLVAAIITP